MHSAAFASKQKAGADGRRPTAQGSGGIAPTLRPSQLRSRRLQQRPENGRGQEHSEVGKRRGVISPGSLISCRLVRAPRRYI